MVEGPIEQPLIAGFEDAHHRAVLLRAGLRLAQQKVSKHRRHGDRSHQRSQDRDDVGDAKRCEEPPLDARKREQWHEHQDDDERRVDDA